MNPFINIQEEAKLLRSSIEDSILRFQTETGITPIIEIIGKIEQTDCDERYNLSVRVSIPVGIVNDVILKIKK